CERKGDCETRTLGPGRFGPDASTVGLGEPACDRKPEPGPLSPFHLRGAFEWLEDALEISLGEGRAPVLDAENGLDRRDSHSHDDVLILGREAQSVLEQVDQGALDLDCVHLHERNLLARKLNPDESLPSTKLSERLPHELVDRDEV